MKIIAALTQPASIRKILDALSVPGAAHRPTSIRAARYEQLERAATVSCVRRGGFTPFRAAGPYGGRNRALTGPTRPPRSGPDSQLPTSTRTP